MAGAKEQKKSAKKKDASAKKTKAKSAPSKPSVLSEEMVVDSSSDGEIEPVKAPPAFPKGEVGDSSDSSEDTSSDSEQEEQEKAAPIPKKPEVTLAKVNGVKRKSEEAESSGSEEDTSSDDEVEQPQPKKARTDAASKNTCAREESTTAAESSIRSIPAPPFLPPPGYAALGSVEPDSGSMLDQSSLNGKQIWHITAPSNVPLTSVTEIALSSLKDQTPVINHKGVDYVLARTKDRSATQYDSVMLPSTAGYTFNGMKIEETLHLQQKIVLPNLSKKQADTLTGSRAAADIAQAPVSDARPQPKGLKMRYRPAGFGKGNPGLGSDTDENEDQVGRTKGDRFQFPKALGVHGASDKPDSSATTSKEKSKKKHQKRKDPYDVDVEMDDADPMMPPPSAQPQKKEKKKKHEQDGEALEKVETMTSQQSGASGQSHERNGAEKKETPEERARRKEAKRLKKEAKKAKQAAA
ncbi:Hypothetical predicted protein [Lecanosticta acicola]|uniref:DNA-directed RNA polymerase I subunit RPA34.5 n=1 Tax=Lecanosticta acicola TaxID=111012 RepID=A0AAI8YWX7_9PEZI|nr:Hypothetical predicted protein [Lecanosticta acicola]